MARKHKSPPAKAKASPTLFGIGFKAALTVLIGIGLLTSLVWIGHRAGQAVSDQPRYQIPISDLQCTAPPGSDRSTFLAEVRVVGSLPETISAVSADTPPLLAHAFAKHPWVSTVDHVIMKPDRTIQVDLTFRVPVLAVKITGEPSLRLVDKTGQLLPVAPVPDLLPVLKGESKTADANVKRAAEIVEMLKEKKPRKIEKTFLGWRVEPESGPALTVGW